MADPKSNPLLLPDSFIFNLDPKDLKRLRIITRRASGNHLTDDECDLLIEEYGTETAVEEVLRKNVGEFR